MTDPTNRYRIPAKRAAYEKALQVAAAIDISKGRAFHDIYLSTKLYELSHENRRQVAAKALRVERGRRRQREAKVIT